MQSENSLLSTYSDIQPIIERYRSKVTASYLFGFISAKVMRGEWDIELALADLRSQLSLSFEQENAFAPVWAEMYTAGSNSLSSEYFDLSAFLPDDEHPLSMRLFCLGDLIKGLLSGLDMEEYEKYFQENTAIREIVQDFQAITEIDVDADDSNDNEKHYMEVEEYIRMGIMFLAEHSIALIQIAQAQNQAQAEQVQH
tara:strand:- start:44360 stop:44953 length:594 start_codon:yes stop_codon:yes gene_type:complete